MFTTALRSCTVISPKAAAIFRWSLVFLGAALLLVPAGHRSETYLAVEVATDAAILLLVARGGRGRGPVLTAMAVSLLAADILYSVTYTQAGFTPFLFHVQVTAYLAYSLSTAWFLLKTYKESGPEGGAESLLLLALFAIFTTLQIKYVAIPTYSGIFASTYVYLMTTVHRTAESGVLALAVLLGMKARSRYWFLMLIGLTLLPLASFAIGYNTTMANGVPFAEYGWVVGLFLLLAAQTYDPGPGQHFAKWSSVRVRLVWFVSLLAAVLLLLLYLMKAFVSGDTFTLTYSLFFMLFGVWLAANLIALRVSEDIDGMLAGLEAGGSAPAGASALTIYEAELFAGRLKAAYDTIKSQSRLAALADLSAQVAHDIRSPLAVLDAALKDVSQFPESKRLLISGAAGRIRDIADDLLEKNRQAGPGARPPEARPLSGLVEAVLAEKRLQFRDRKEVLIEAELGPEAGGILVLVRPAEFNRVLSNLVNNGVEALEPGGRVLVSFTAVEDSVMLKVSDNGRGIAPEILARLGQRGETHGKAGGSGLGLYHAKAAAEGWGGSLSVSSEIGKGTTVALTLPRAARRAGGRALLLDDDALVRLNWKTAASAAGVNFSAYEKIAEFLAAAAAEPADTPLFIDSELGVGRAGEEVALDLHEKGFLDITLATGHAPEKFAQLTWLKVAGKEPPWDLQA